MNAADQWADLMATIVAESEAGATAGSAPAIAFVSTALQVNRKMFALFAKDRLVVKLPAKRVDELIAAGAGGPYDPGTGKPQREWLAIPSGAGEQWLPLAREAMAFVAGKR